MIHLESILFWHLRDESGEVTEYPIGPEILVLELVEVGGALPEEYSFRVGCFHRDVSRGRSSRWTLLYRLMACSRAPTLWNASRLTYPQLTRATLGTPSEAGIFLQVLLPFVGIPDASAYPLADDQLAAGDEACEEIASRGPLSKHRSLTCSL